MNKKLKRLLISINSIMLLVALWWLYDKREQEPIIVALGQVATLAGLVFETKASKFFAKNIDRSEIKIRKQDGDDIHTENVRDSNIKYE